MKKVLIILMFLSLFLSGCGNNNSSENQELNNNYTASRITATNDNNTNTNSNMESNNTAINNVESIDNTETEIASFSTKIYTPNDSARQTNIKLTCSELNETIVKSRRNFFVL